MGNKSSKQSRRAHLDTSDKGFLLSLPEDVIIQILRMLDSYSLTRAVCTCSRMKEIAYNSTRLWSRSVMNLARLTPMSGISASSIRRRGIPAIQLSQWRLSSKSSVFSKSTKRFSKRMLQAIRKLPLSETDIDTFMLSYSYKDLPIQPSDFMHLDNLKTLILIITGTCTSDSIWSLERFILDYPLTFPQLQRLTFVVNIENDGVPRPVNYPELEIKTIDFGRVVLEGYGRHTIRDFTIGKTYHNHSGATIPEVFDSVFHSSDYPNGSPTLERLHICSGKLSHHAVQLKQETPELKHLHLGQLIVGDYDEQSTQLTRAQSLLDGLTKLSSFRFQVQVDIQTDSMITLPEGISAVGVSGPVSTSSLIHVLAKINYSSMLRVLELDSTTYQDGFLTTCAENPLVRLLESLKHLEVLILSKTSNITVCAEIASVIRSKTTLYSVIGIDFGSSRFKLPAQIHYITDSCVSSIISNPQHQTLLRRLSVNTWACVQKYSSAWHEAFGTAFFYPESSIDRSYGVINDFVEEEWELHNHRCKKIEDNYR